jgi:hypothetical protein
MLLSLWNTFLSTQTSFWSKYGGSLWDSFNGIPKWFTSLHPFWQVVIAISYIVLGIYFSQQENMGPTLFSKNKVIVFFHKLLHYTFVVVASPALVIIILYLVVLILEMMVFYIPWLIIWTVVLTLALCWYTIVAIGYLLWYTLVALGYMFYYIFIWPFTLLF